MHSRIIPIQKTATSVFAPRFAKERKAPVSPIWQNCAIQRQCESCRYVNQGYETKLRKKFDDSLKDLSEKNLLIKTRIVAPQPAERNFQYRSTLKLAVRENSDSTLGIGLFHPGTHEIVDISTCPLHIEPLQKLISRLSPLLKSAAKQGLLKAWNEITQEGDLRYFIARASHTTDEIQIIFVVSNDEKKAYFRDLVKDFRMNGMNIVSAFLNINTTSGNDIYGREFIKIAGQDHLRVSFNGLLLGASPGTFLQANPWQAEIIYNRIAQFCGHADQSELAWDLYCGIGPIALSLAKHKFRVWGVEENPHAINDAKLNVGRNDIPETQMGFNSGLLENELETVPFWAENPSLIVVNPSRRGLAENVREKLLQQLSGKNRLRHILYLSCEVKTMARDLEVLLSQGARLNQVEAFDMFPHTDKLEWLAVITPPRS